jgi:hypothetical protein
MFTLGTVPPRKWYAYIYTKLQYLLSAADKVKEKIREFRKACHKGMWGFKKPWDMDN